jgi:hypothetical protein
MFSLPIGSGGKYPHVLNPDTASHPRRFAPGERTPGTQRVGGWVGTRTGLDTVE